MQTQFTSAVVTNYVKNEKFKHLLNNEVLVHDVEENTYRRGIVIETSMNFMVIQSLRGIRTQYPVRMIETGYYEIFMPLEFREYAVH